MQKKIPQRQCMGCRERKNKADMLRIVRSPQGVVSLDPKGKAPGRGTYICPDPACLKKAQKSRALERALEAKIEDGVFEQLAAQIRPQVQS